MKKIIATLLMILMVAGALSGCGKKDYSFTQEEWDKNDLSFVESTPDPNEAYRVISYFAKRYEDYYAGYVTSQRAEEYNCIRLGSATIERLLVIDYYILEDAETAKNATRN